MLGWPLILPSLTLEVEYPWRPLRPKDPLIVVFKIVLSRPEELCRLWSGTRNGELCCGALKAGETRPGVVGCRKDMAEPAR